MSQQQQPARHRGAGLAAVVVATTGFSWGFIIVKAVPLAAGAIAFWRLLIGLGALLLAAAVLRTPWPRRLTPVVAAGVAFGVHQVVFIEATQRTSVAIVTLVGALQPLVVALLARSTLGEPVSARLRWCTVLAVVGTGVVLSASVGHASHSLAGDVLSVVNLALFTAYFLFAKRSREQGAPALTMTAAAFAVSLVVVTPMLLLGGATVPATTVDAGLLAVLALLPGNGHLLLNWAHPRVSATLASLALALIPLLSSVWARLVLGEPYGPAHLVGMLLVLASIEIGRRVEGPRPVREIVPALE